MLVQDIDPDKLSSDFSLYSALTLIFSIAPGVYIHRVISLGLSQVHYTLGCLSIGYVLGHITNTVYLYFYGNYLISVELLCLMPLLSLHMIIRNRYIYFKNKNKTIVTDILFTVIFYYIYLIILNLEIVENILNSYFLMIFIIGIIGVAKQKQVQMELLKAINSGVSNFCSGGVILILPYIIGKLDESITYVTMFSVSVLGMAMLLPRVLLLKKTRDIVRSTKSHSAYKFLDLNRIILLKLLLVSVLLGSLVVLIYFSQFEALELREFFICLAIAGYYLFSQLSLFDCNYIIYKGDSFKLLRVNVILLLGYASMSVIIYFFNSIYAEEYVNLGIVNIYILLMLMILRYRYILRVVTNENKQVQADI